MYKVVVVDQTQPFGGVSEIVKLQSLEEANTRAVREVADTISALTGGWRVVRKSMSRGQYGAWLESPVQSGYIVVMVAPQ